MSKCNYRATINKIQTISCDYHLIANESGEKIVWYVDEALEHNFQSPFELNYIVDTADPICDIDEKSKYHATIKPLSDIVNKSIIDEGVFSATFSQSVYRAEINCSTIDLQSTHKFFATGNLALDVDSGGLAIQVTNQTEFNVGNFIVIDPGTNIEEYRTIVDIGSLILDNSLNYAHKAGAIVKQVRSIPNPSPTPTSSLVLPSVTPSSSIPLISITPSKTPQVTPTKTSSFTPSTTPTFSITQTNTQSSTMDSTTTPTQTNTLTPTVTPSFTQSSSQTPTTTPSITQTNTQSSSPDLTSTPTQTNTLTSTLTPSITQTNTQSSTIGATLSPTQTNTVTPTVTPSFTQSSSQTPTTTPSITQTNTQSSSPDLTSTPTQTNTLTPTVTPSFTQSSSQTPTLTPSVTQTHTQTPTVTPSVTRLTFSSNPDQDIEFTINNIPQDPIFNDSSYRETIQAAVDKWDRVLVSKPFSNWQLEVGVEYDTMEPNILGGAAISHFMGTTNFGSFFPSSGRLILNTVHLESKRDNIGNAGFSELYYVCLHEVGHLLGIGNFTLSENSTIAGEPVVRYTEDGVDKFYYTGEHAFQAYKDYLEPLGYNVSELSGIPTEDDGGQGTAHSHPEEGLLHGISVNDRFIGGVFHPGLEHELMAGWSENGNYNPLSKISIGFLEDMGYEVNYDEAEPYNPEDPNFGLVSHIISPANQGETFLTVSTESQAKFKTNQEIIIDEGLPVEETNIISSLDNPGIIDLKNPLQHSHNTNAPIKAIGIIVSITTTPTQTQTVTPSVTQTPTNSASITPSSTHTQTTTPSLTKTQESTPTLTPSKTPTPTPTNIRCVSSPVTITVESEFISPGHSDYKYITSDSSGEGGLFGCINAERGSTLTIFVTGDEPNLVSHPLKITNFNNLGQAMAPLDGVVKTDLTEGPTEDHTYSLTWTVPCDTTIDKYQYQCENHAHMRGTINVFGECPTPSPTLTPSKTPTPTPTNINTDCDTLPAVLPMVLCNEGSNSSPTTLTPSTTYSPTATPSVSSTLTPSPTKPIENTECDSLPATLPIELC